MPPAYRISSRRHAELALASRLSGEERDQDNWSYLARSMETEVIDAPYTFSPSASSAYDSPLFVSPQSDDSTASRPPSPLLLLTDAFAPLARNSPTHAKGHRRRREPDYIPRPRNAYIIFRSYYIQTNCGSGKKKQDDISKVASNVWNNMTEEEKQPFIQAAFEEKVQHKLKYPDYKYKPGAPSAAPRAKSVKTKARYAQRMMNASTSPSSLSPSAFARATLDAPSPSSSSCFSSDAYSPDLDQCHIPLSSISAAQSVANDLERLALGPSLSLLSPLSLELELGSSSSSDPTSPTSPAKIMTDPINENGQIPTFSFDVSFLHENEKGSVPEFTLDPPSTLDCFKFDFFTQYGSYPNHSPQLPSGSTLPSVVPTMVSTNFNDFYNWGMPVDQAIDNLDPSYLESFQYEPSNSEQLPLGDLGFHLGGYDDFQAYGSDAQAQMTFDLDDLVHMDRL